MNQTLLNQLRHTNPIVANISNHVTVDQVANVQNVIGASPIMSSAPEEAADIVAIAQAITVNIGTLAQPQIDQMVTLLQAAYQMHKPVVLDPVAVGSLTYRQGVIDQLLTLGTPDIIRGNDGEIAYFAGIDWQANGIDAGSGQADIVDLAQQAARKLNTTILLTGPTDVVTDGTRVTQIFNGTPLFQTHVGSGDMLTGVCGAFVGMLPDDPYQAAVAAATTFAVTGQLVAEAMPQPLPGSFYPQLLDRLFTVTTEEISQKAQLKESN